MTSTSEYYVPNYFNQEHQSPKPSINELLYAGLFISRHPNANQQLSVSNSSQEIESANLHQRIKELEFEIESINNKYDEMKTKLTKELENEINLRKKVEEECSKKLEDYIKKENIEQQKYSNTNYKLSEYESKIRDLEDQIQELEEKNKIMKKTTNNQILSMQSELNKKTQLYNEEILILTKDNELLGENIDTQFNQSKSDKKKIIEEYETINQKLKYLITKYENNNKELKGYIENLNKIKNDELKEKIMKIKEEMEKEKHDFTKEYESIFKQLEAQKNETINNYNALNERFKEQNQNVQEEKSKLESELIKLKNENKLLLKQSQVKNSQMNKDKLEVDGKDELILNLKNQITQVSINIQNHFFDTDKKIDNLTQEFNRNRIDWEKERHDLLDQINNLEMEETKLILENEQLKSQTETFKENLKNRIQQVIQQLLDKNVLNNKN